MLSYNLFRFIIHSQSSHFVFSSEFTAYFLCHWGQIVFLVPYNVLPCFPPSITPPSLLLLFFHTLLTSFSRSVIQSIFLFLCFLLFTDRPPTLPMNEWIFLWKREKYNGRGGQLLIQKTMKTCRTERGALYILLFDLL